MTFFALPSVIFSNLSETTHGYFAMKDYHASTIAKSSSYEAMVWTIAAPLLLKLVSEVCSYKNDVRQQFRCKL